MTRPLRALALVALAAATPALSLLPARAGDGCGEGAESYFITGYVRGDFAGPTADGTPILTDEAIAAGSYNLPLGSYVYAEGLGVYRIADRGYLGRRHLDLAVWSREEAYTLTGTYCVWRLE